jgi:tripeptide aminopeptidase
MESKQLIDTFCRLVQIDSESGEEKKVILYLKDLFEKEFQAKCIIDGYGNLIAAISPKNTSRTEPVLFGMHADTVKPGKGIEPVLDNGIIRSKGQTILGADDKAGIAEFVEGLRTAECYPPMEVVISREEEVGHLGTKNLDISMLKSRMGFVLDSKDLDTIIIGGPSNMFIDIKITGKAAHAGMNPEKGISAIRAASNAIAIMKEGWIDKETTVNVGTIKGGNVRNSVPEKAELQAQCRSLNHDKCVHQSDLVKQVFETAALTMGARAEVKLNLAYKAMKVPEDAEVVMVAQKAIDAMGLKPKLRVIGGGSDASEYNAKGIQSVVLGTGGHLGHTLEEHIYVEELQQAVLLIKQIFRILSK